MSLSGPKSPRATEPNTRTLLAPRPSTVSRIFALFSFKIFQDSSWTPAFLHQLPHPKSAQWEGLPPRPLPSAPVSTREKNSHGILPQPFEIKWWS